MTNALREVTFFIFSPEGGLPPSIARMVKKLKTQGENTGKRSRPISRNRLKTDFSPNGVLAGTT